RPRRGAEPQDRDRPRRRPPRDVRRPGQRHHPDRVPPRRPGELPDGRRRLRRPEPRHPAALRRGQARRLARHPRHPRRRQRRPQRLQRHQGHLHHRRGRLQAGDRGSGRPVPEALGRVRRPHQPDGRHRRGRLKGTIVIERHTTTVVIGAGHAGLAASHFLTERSIDHVVLERGEVANSWRSQRWDSFRLLTPNWQSRLPGLGYDGPDPDGYMTIGEVTAFMERFAAHTRAPVRTRTDVTSVRRAGDGYRVTTNDGEIDCRTVVIASGACNLPAVPPFSAAVPPEIEQITPYDYREPGQLPEGGVLVVGASATGVQLAAVVRRVGGSWVMSWWEHVRLPRTYRGRDVLWWMGAAGVWDQRYGEGGDLTRARRLPSPQLVGSPERETLDLNALTA